MSRSRSPSPHPGSSGGWASPGLSNGAFARVSGRSSPHNGYSIGSRPSSINGLGVTWESAKAKAEGLTNNYPSFSTQNNGFFNRHYRRISGSLPRFVNLAEKGFADKERSGRSRWLPREDSRLERAIGTVGRTNRKTRLRVLLVFGMFLVYILFYATPLHYWWRRSKVLGGGKKYVIILAANQGGGVMEWKGAREWAIERDSIRNKRKYANRWGYELEIVDMSTKKRYAHEWRESWEKVDTIRNSLRKYPDAEWFWWLDLNTFIMELGVSLQSHIFNQLEAVTYRDINEYNPLNITHPFSDEYLDPISRSASGDGSRDSLNLLLAQDCSGFNLGSFFVKRSAWTERLLDVWWDPVGYEQKHMEWDHKEQDALEALYTTQPWVRSHVGFLPQRWINSFPPAACNENGNNTRYHYDVADRDFLVNMAGCEWGRDCWEEIYHYRELSNRLNRTWWELFKEEIVAKIWFWITGQKIRI